MFGKRIALFRISGFEVRADASWLVLAVLVTWSLAAGVFPFYFPGLPASTYWGMGVAGAAGLFLSIVLHELSHSLVARRHGTPMKGITLFIFGGVAEMDEEPRSARAEFLMAAAGPASSVALSAIFFGIRAAAEALGSPTALSGVIGYLAYINLALAAFNLIPAFPLDGGRILRSALWRFRGDLRRATRTAARAGGGFGWILIALGLWRVVRGDFIGGMWWALIGFFLRNGAAESYRQLLLREALSGETVRRFMNASPVTVPRGITLGSFVEDHVYRSHFKMYPVVEDGRLVGCIRTRDLKAVPRAEWGTRIVADIARPCDADNTVASDTDALRALQIMRRTGNSRLLVLEGERLEGVITLKDLLGFFSVKMDLEGESDERGRRAA